MRVSPSGALAGVGVRVVVAFGGAPRVHEHTVPAHRAMPTWLPRGSVVDNCIWLTNATTADRRFGMSVPFTSIDFVRSRLSITSTMPPVETAVDVRFNVVLLIPMTFQKL